VGIDFTRNIEETVISRDVIVGGGARGSNKSSWQVGETMRKKELILTAFRTVAY